MRDYEVVSTDSHLEVSPDRWRPYVDPAFQEYVPKVVQLPGGGDAWLMPGKSQPVPLGLNFSAGRGWENLKVSGLSYAEGLVGAGDGKQRLAEMDQDGVDAEILFPPQRTMSHFLGDDDEDFVLAGVEAYNNFLLEEFCSPDPSRLIGLPAHRGEPGVAAGAVLHEFRRLVLPLRRQPVGPDVGRFEDVTVGVDDLVLRLRHSASR